MNEGLPIDPRPSWIRTKEAAGERLRLLTVDGTRYPYTIIQPGLINPQFPYAVGFGDPKALYISANVPPEDMEPILAHEVREHIRFPDLLEEERCTAALAAELSEVQLTRNDKDYKKYVKSRTDYFNALLRYYQAPEHAAGITPGFHDGLLTAASYINHISAGLKKSR